MKLYVFETDKWIESDVVYPHDIAVCLNPENRTIYVWEGPRATTVMKKQAMEGLEEVALKFPHFTIEHVNENTPEAISSYINQFVNTSFEEIETIDRDPQYVAFYYVLLVLFGGLLFGYIMIFRIIGWPRMPGSSYIIVSETTFTAWLNQNFVILIVLASIFVVDLIFAGLTKKIFLIVTASTGVIIMTGTFLYFRLREFLFGFLSGSPLGYYYIPIGQITVFFFLNLAALGVILVPMVISVFAILKTTTPIAWKQWMEKRKKSVVEMKKFSILDMVSEFTEIDHNLDEENATGNRSHSDQ
jgi:hypothetical protein